jgi:putative transposase
VGASGYGVARRGDDPVGSLIQQLVNYVACIIDIVEILALEAAHGIGAAAPAQNVVAVVARADRRGWWRTVRNKAVYIALDILPDGTKEILGIWIEQTKGAKFWLRVMNETRSRGVGDILIAFVDGLKGFPEAINAVFPQTVVQTCIVRRHDGLEVLPGQELQGMTDQVRAIYRAKDAEAGMKALEDFERATGGQRYPAITQSWRRNWQHVVPFLAYPESVRRIICPTNAIEALNSKLRRAVRTRGHFPSDDAAMKLLYLVLNHAAEEWKRPPREWFEAKTQFAVVFGERFVSQGRNRPRAQNS